MIRCLVAKGIYSYLVFFIEVQRFCTVQKAECHRGIPLCGNAGPYGHGHNPVHHHIYEVTKMNYGKDILNINSEFGVAAALEARRLAEKYGKDYLNCDDLVLIMGIGKNNARHLLNSSTFPTIEVGNRKVVSVIAFALWSLQENYKYA